MSGTGKCILAALFVLAIRNSRKAQPCAGMKVRTWSNQLLKALKPDPRSVP